MLAVRTLWPFMRERFPLQWWLPFCALLALGLARVAHFAALACLALCFLAMLGWRIGDDLTDLERDRTRYPTRGLTCGRVSVAELQKALLMIGASIFALAATIGGAIGALWASAGVGYYALYYGRLRARLSPCADTLAVNAVFCWLPLLAARSSLRSAASLAAFCWCAMVAHDWLHDVHAPDERVTSPVSLSRLFGARTTASIGLVLSLTSAVLGGLAWSSLAHSPPFGLGLLLSELLTGVLALRLVQRPGAARARPLYFAAALVPSLPLGLEGIWAQLEPP
jgi:4-hydroxybenzoate polyprenyltransferase